MIVVDTGESARTSDKGYFPTWHPYSRFGLREWAGPDEEIGPQLERLGIRPGTVRTVVLTHLHTDYAGGLHHFPHNEILVSRADAAVASGFGGRLRGYPNNRYPAWLEPKIVDLPPVPYGPFPQSLPLTRAGDAVLVPTPGHTPGQMGVVVRDRNLRVLLAGDTSEAGRGARSRDGFGGVELSGRARASDGSWRPRWFGCQLVMAQSLPGGAAHTPERHAR